ncbi:DnaJ domain-containing protein [Rubrivirga sp. IMCC45206]|uniref:DnaJ domain-containing protein n=1 Tax=Rubrivirga sp. IMCC45206 TaxID=3391614 RepID=UPI00398FE103
MARDPFRTLALPYDAAPGDVRAAFRRLARQTHPDQGGSADAFHRVRLAYDALIADLDAERQRWAPARAPAPRHPAGLDPAVYPTCPVRIARARDGTRRVTYETARRPPGWRPGPAPPPGGTCVAHAPATETSPAVGIWSVPLGARTVRYVFGPAG